MLDHVPILKTPEDLFRLLSSANTEPEYSDASYRYVLYVRKSTDESDKQERSLSDQKKDCLEMAEKNNLNIVAYVEESASAKESDIRPKFRQMLTDIEQGKYDGIIAWHPNRLARNMRGAGEIIDMLDKDIIRDLRFASFSYTKDSSGKMVLGMTFVLSKQYSDQLSDAVSRGNRRSLEEGYYVNKAKHGYIKDRNKRLRPDGRNFALIQEAFQKRLNGENLETIRDYLNSNQYSRTNAKGNQTYESHVTKQMISKILKDPVYTGVLVYGGRVFNLTEIYNFVPAVSVPDFMKINKMKDQSQYLSFVEKIANDAAKAKLLNGCIYCFKCGKKRYPGITTKKLKSGKKKSVFYYRCMKKGCVHYNKSTRARVIINFVIDFLSKKPFSSLEVYDHYVNELKRVSKDRLKIYNAKLASVEKSIVTEKNRLSDLKDRIVTETDSELKAWQKEKIDISNKNLSEHIKHKQSLKNSISSIKDALLSSREFFELLEKIPEIIAKTKKMSDLDFLIRKIFSNFTTSSKRVEKYTLNEPFASLYKLNETKVSDGGGSKYALELVNIVEKRHKAVVLWNEEFSSFISSYQPTANSSGIRF